MTTSDSSKHDAFWGGARSGLAAATIFVAALSGTFYGTGLPRIVEALIGALAGAVCFYGFVLVARWLARALRHAPSESYVFLVAALGAFVVIRATRFRWSADLFYPAAIVFLLAQATLVGAAWAWIRSEGNRKLLGGLMAAALLVDVAGFAGLAYGGRDPYPVSVESEGPGPPRLDAPNPGEPGRFEVETLTYGSGTDRRRPEYGEDVTIETPTVDASKLLPQWKGFKARAREWYWGFSLEEAPLNARVWAPKGEGPFPLVLVVHGNHSMEDYSDPGYAYLGELLASRGFITASVDENFINATWSGDFRGKEMPLRGWLLLEHLRLWREWNRTEGHRFHGKVDLDRIALIGHSRGGEAVAIAAAFNALPYFPDDASVAFDYGFSIRAVVAIAQTDYRYPRRVKLENVDFFTLHGSYDSDESGFHGLRQLHRIRFTDDAYRFKAGLYIHRANHGQFNTTWGRRDAGPPGAWLLNVNPIIPGEAQRQVAKVAIAGFLEASLHEDRRYLPLFRDIRVASAWLPDDLILVPQFEDSTFTAVADYEEDLDVTTASLAGASIETEGLTLWREEELHFRDELKQYTSGVVTGWSGSEASYTIRLDGVPEPRVAVGEDAVLSFSLASSKESPDKSDGEEEDGPLELAVELEDEDGQLGRVLLTEIKPIVPPLETRFLKIARLNRRVYKASWEPTLASFEIPLARFGALDLSRLKSIRFRHASGAGVVIVDNVGFRSAPPEIEPEES